MTSTSPGRIGLSALNTVIFSWQAHDGTIEYTSRDAHIGAHARRSDLEILGYNLVHWMSGQLPWMDNLTNFQYVHMQKNGFMNEIPSFLLRCFGEDQYPGM